MTTCRRDDFVLICAAEWPRVEEDVSSGCLVSKPRSSASCQPGDDLRHRLAFLTRHLRNAGQFTLIEGLLCESSCDATILALLLRDSDGSLLAGDLTGSVKVELTAATKYEKDVVFFEGGCYVVQGSYEDGTLTARSLRLPSLKPLSEMPALPEADSFSRLAHRPCRHSDFVVVLSDVWVDLPEVGAPLVAFCFQVFDALLNVLSGYSDSPPALFVLCGAFCSAPNSEDALRRMRDAFAHLSDVLLSMAGKFKNTKFVFVPGPEDPPSRSPLPK